MPGRKWGVVFVRKNDTCWNRKNPYFRIPTGMAAAATVETSTSTHLSAAVKDFTDVKSTSITLTLSSYAPGFLERVRTVTSKFASTSALRT